VASAYGNSVPPCAERLHRLERLGGGRQSFGRRQCRLVRRVDRKDRQQTVADEFQDLAAVFGDGARLAVEYLIKFGDHLLAGDAV
jgi:hypothetical protein